MVTQTLGGPFQTGSHCIIIILANINHWEIPQSSHISSLEYLALKSTTNNLISSSIAIHTHGHILFPHVPLCIGQARSDRHLRAHNAVPAVVVVLLGVEVHGAALALGTAGHFSQLFGDYLVHGDAAGQSVAVVSVGRD